MIEILILDKLNPKITDKLKEIPEFDITEKEFNNPKELITEIGNFESVIVSNSPLLTGEVINHTQTLQLIVKAGVELDNIDLKAAKSKNIEVRNTPFANAITMAEYTMAQFLGICRFIGPAYKSMKEHRWDKELFINGSELFGKTAGIIGFGRVGQEVAKRELAFGMKVIYHDIKTKETDLNVDQVELPELLKESDFISIHLPLTRDTKNLLSNNELSQMKPEVIIINVSQSGVVDESALLKALDENKIKAVALDIYDRIPPENFDLIDHDGVYPFPNLGTSTVEGQFRAGFDIVSILKEYFNV